MTYKEFNSWCNKRAADGCWPLSIALTCCEECSAVMKLPFFKKHKKLKEDIPEVYQDIVNFINEHYSLMEVDINGK